MGPPNPGRTKFADLRNHASLSLPDIWHASLDCIQLGDQRLHLTTVEYRVTVRIDVVQHRELEPL